MQNMDAAAATLPAESPGPLALEVNRAELSRWQIRHDALETMGETGAVLLEVERFGFSANNVSYAVFADALRYWDFFPACSPDHGRIPVWGIVRVVRSDIPGVPPGSRYYGFVPMASHLVVRPVEIAADGFRDSAGVRASLPPDYNWYERIAPGSEGGEDILVAAKPVFTAPMLLSLLLEDHGVSNVVMTSASSKTALALGWLLAQRPHVRRVGITSSHARGLIAASGLFEEVHDYDHLDGLAADGPTWLIDFNGSAETRHRLHSALHPQLERSLIVGTTHWNAWTGLESDIAGPQPELFIGYAVIQTYWQRWGEEGFRQRLNEQWERYAQIAASLFSIETVVGGPAIGQCYEQAITAGFAPNKALIMRFA
jgi:hypothetical protein